MYKKILVPLDGSELAECVLPHVEAITKGCSVPDVIFVRVFEPLRRMGAGGDYYVGVEEWGELEKEHRAATQDYLKKLVARLKFENANLQWKVLPPNGVAESIAEFVTKNDVDLIVISTHGRSGVSRWVFGSTADRILRSSCVPVMMVRAPGCIPGVQT